jgi:hypothetical protein
MKKITTLGLGIISVIIVSAQNKESGLFITELDFENKKISYSTQDPLVKNRIQFHELLNRPYVTIKSNGDRTRLFKEDIFAYQNKGRIVRTVNFVSYTLLEKGPLWIYFRDMNAPQGKGSQREKKYYYAISSKDEIRPLTINNLKKTFPDKYLFHHLLDAQFRSDKDLAAFDRFKNKFKVNYLLETTIYGTAISAP